MKKKSMKKTADRMRTIDTFAENDDEVRDE
jgi:hypothetical protein